MIKFFKKIRQNLLMENKTGKYFKYAIGEIVLVVIGILIALSINNWNQNQKQKSKELEILNSLSVLLVQDKNMLDNLLPYNKRVRESIDLILTHLNDDLPYQDSLKNNFGNTLTFWSFSVKTSVFQNLESEGVNLISNADLRREIIDYYDESARFSDRTLQQNYRELIEDASQNLLNTRFKSIWESNYEDWILEVEKNNGKQTRLNIQLEMEPNDYESLKKDTEYLFFLKSLKNFNSWYIERIFRMRLIKVKNLKVNIEKELKLLE